KDRREYRGMSEDADKAPARRRSTGRYILAFLPLIVFAGFAFVAGKMLYDQDVNGLDISTIPSALIGQKAPSLSLPALEGADIPALTDAAIEGRLTLVNVFASWCVPCRQERPILKALAKDDRLTIVGIDYKDREIGRTPLWTPVT